MNGETIAAIQAGRLDFQGLLSRPFTFADSPSINSAATRAASLPAAAPAAEGGTARCLPVIPPAAEPAADEPAPAVVPAASQPASRQNGRRRPPASAGGPIVRQPLAPIVWDDDAF